MKRTWKAVFIFAAWFLVSLPLVAQDTSYEFNQGFNNYNSFTVGAFDAVNEDNLNLMVDVPIVSYPQRGTLPDYKLNVHYNGWSWYMTCAILNGQQQCRWHPGTYGSAYITDNLTLSGGSRYCSPNNNCFAPCPCRTYWVKDASGAIHNIGATASGNMAIDGSGIKLDSTSSWTTRDGIRISNAGAFLDPSGNAITKTYVAGGGSYTTDSMGRIIPTDVPRDTGGHPVPGCVVRNFPSPNGGTAPITFCSASYTVTSPIPNPNLGINAFPSIFTMGALQSITLPNNTSWNFYYSTGGDLIQITTPIGGSISYTWGNQWLESNSTQAYSRVVLTRTVNANDGTGNKTWTYSATLNGTVQPGVTDPDSNFTVFSNEYSPAPRTNSGVWTRRQYYTSAGVLLKTVDTSYIGAEDHLDRWQIAGSPGLVQYILPVGTTTTFPNGQVTQTILTYDSGATWYDVYTPGSSYYLPYGDVVEKQEYDYGPSPHGPLLRDTKTVYQWQTNASYLNANLFDLIASVNVYDGANNTCKGQTSPCAQTTYAYDENNGSPQGIYGNQTSVTRWLNGGTSPKTQYVYNAQGMRTKMCDPMDTACANPTIYTYDSTGLFLSQLQYPNTGTAHIETFSYDKNTGLLNWHKDQNLQQTTFGYDSMRRLTSVSYPDGGSETYVHTDTIPNPYFTFTKKITSSANFVGTGIVDGFGRGKQTKTTVPTSTCSGGYSYVDTTYDNEGRKYSVSNPYCTTSDTTYGLTKTYYDALNRPCLVVPPDGTPPSGNSCPTTSPTNDIFTIYSGNTATVTDQAGKARKSQTDGLGRLTALWEDPNGLNYQTNYTYDALDNLLSVSQSGSRQRTFAYDSLSRLLCAANPEIQVVTCPSPDSGSYTAGTIRYAYDSNSNLTSKTAPKPNQSSASVTVTTSDQYDALNRLTQKTYSDSTPTVSYAYDGVAPTNCTVAFSYGSYPKSRRTAMCDAAGNEAWLYDLMGRTLTDQRTTNSITKSTTYTYNLDSSVATLNYPSARTITYTPNIAAQPVSAVDTANSINYATMALYAPQGALRSLSNGNGTGILSTMYYDKRLQACRMAANATGNAPGSCVDTANKGDVMDFSYDLHLGVTDNGNVYKVSNNRTNASDRNINYTYDALNRISQAYTDGNLWGETYSIDTWGNLYGIGAYAGKPAGETLSQGVNAANQLTNACSANCYDAAGNLLNDGLNSYTYDAENHINMVDSSLSYYYDGDGKRVRKSSGTLYWYGMGSDALDETDASGNLTNEYIFFGGKRIARRDASSNVFYYFADHLGTSREIVQAGQATPCYDQDFYPYGREVPHTTEIPAFVNTCPQNYKFTGKERDSESGLDNFGARYDSSQYGRFMTPDPVEITTERLQNPQQLNLYAYVADNPLRFVDATGEILQCVGNDDQQRQCFADLQQIAGDVANRLSIDAKTGVVSFDTTGLDLSKNAGGALVNDLVGSKNTFDFSIGPTVMTDKGSVKIDYITANLPTFGDQPKNGNPPPGVSDIVGLYFNNPKVTQVSNTNLKIAPEWTVAFHELAEAYEKIDGGKGGSYAAGHNAALQREMELRDQRPYLKEYNTGAGGPANSPNPQGGIIIKK